TITVANQVWYVDASAGNGGDGTSTNPFNELSDVSGAGGPDTAGDFIYLNSGTYSRGMALLNAHNLVGEGAALVVGPTMRAVAGTDATITNAAGHGVDLASGNTLTGLTIGNTTGFDIANNGSAGDLIISNVDLTGTGGLIRVTSGGNLNVTLDTATTTSATG